jgi:hypothetical protein
MALLQQRHAANDNHQGALRFKVSDQGVKQAAGKPERRLMSRPHFRALRDLLIVTGRAPVFAKISIRPVRQPCRRHVALDDMSLKSPAPRTFERPKVIARFGGLDVRKNHW